jgi:hypothetical protein
MQCPKCAREVNSVDVKVCISEERVYELRLNDEGKQFFDTLPVPKMPSRNI